MVMAKHSVLAAAAILRLVSVSHAAPSPYPGAIQYIGKRAISGWEGCGDDNDPKRIKAVQAFADAAQLASWTSNKQLDDGTSFADTKAYSHYLESSDNQIVTDMMKLVGQNNNPSYSFMVSSCVRRTPTVRLCPAFFDKNTPQTKNDLKYKGTNRNPKRNDNSWCKPGQSFAFYETAGHTVFHEMTHLDALAQAAGVPSRPVKDESYQSHGTDDIYEIANGYDRGSPERSARKLKDKWTTYNNDNKKKMPELQRVENAEGFAAAATEFYFQQVCGFTEIMP